MILNQTDAPIKASGTSDSSHWYCFENGVWSPLYTPEKNYTLREARKDKEAGRIVVPSVTTIFKVLAKPQLVKWQMEQVAKAAMESPRDQATGIPDDEWIDSVIATANNVSRGAMDLGSRVHESIENCVAGRDYDADLQIYVAPVMEERAKRGVRWSVTEVCAGSAKYGYGCRGDDFSDETKTYRDYKSRKSKGRKVPVYETDFIQVSACGFARWGNEFFKSGHGEIWGISTSEPGALTVHEKTGPEMIEDFSCFLALTQVWSHMNRFNAKVAA
jgi:hypothetical protein